MQSHEALNAVVIAMDRSLLQYVPTAWPWTPDAERDLRKALDGLIAGQANRIRKIVDFMEARRWPIEFGSYPDFTDLHFLSLESLLPHLVQNERPIIAEIEIAQAQTTIDPLARALLNDVLLGERAALAQLEDLARSTRLQSTV